jgi:hypothetical protein
MTIIQRLFKNAQTEANKAKIPQSVEGILRLLSNRAADPERGCGAFDTTLPIEVAAARFKQYRTPNLNADRLLRHQGIRSG